MDINTLKIKIREKRLDEAINIIKEIGRSRSKEAVAFLIEELETTDNHNLRDTIAIALSDIGCEEALIPIIKLIKHPKTNGHKGTLLYALRPFDYAPYFDMLVDFVIDGYFELSRESLYLIDAIADRITYDIRTNSLSRIECKIKDLVEQVDFLDEARELIDKNHK